MRSQNSLSFSGEDSSESALMRLSIISAISPFMAPRQAAAVWRIVNGFLPSINAFSIPLSWPLILPSRFKRRVRSVDFLIESFTVTQYSIRNPPQNSLRDLLLKSAIEAVHNSKFSGTGSTKRDRPNVHRVASRIYYTTRKEASGRGFRSEILHPCESNTEAKVARPPARPRPLYRRIQQSVF